MIGLQPFPNFKGKLGSCKDRQYTDGQYLRILASIPVVGIPSSQGF